MKEEDAKKQAYKKMFLKKAGNIARNGKMVYIPKDMHEMIMAICHVIGKNKVSLADYVKNVLSEHFNTYGKEITTLYNENHKGINIPKNRQ